MSDDQGFDLVSCVCMAHRPPMVRFRALDMDERHKIEREAWERNQNALRRGQGDVAYKMDDDGAMRAHRLGVEGEYAFCMMHGLPFDWHGGKRYGQLPDIDPIHEVRLRAGEYVNLKITDRDVSDAAIEGYPSAPVRSQRRFHGIFKEGDDSYRYLGWIYGYEARPWGHIDPGGRGEPARFIPGYRLHRYPWDGEHLVAEQQGLWV